MAYNNQPKYTAGIQRSKDGERLALFFSNGDGQGWEFPASRAGLAAAKKALKNDNMVARADHKRISALRMPQPGERNECEVTGDGE